MPYDEEPLLDALARLHVAGKDDGRRGLPVRRDVPRARPARAGLGPALGHRRRAVLEEPAAAARAGTSRRRWRTAPRSPPTSGRRATASRTGSSPSADPCADAVPRRLGLDRPGKSCVRCVIFAPKCWSKSQRARTLALPGRCCIPRQQRPGFHFHFPWPTATQIAQSRQVSHTEPRAVRLDLERGFLCARRPCRSARPGEVRRSGRGPSLLLPGR